MAVFVEIRIERFNRIGLGCQKALRCSVEEVYHELPVRVAAVAIFGGARFAGSEMRRRFPAELHADSFTQLETFAPALAGEGG